MIMSEFCSHEHLFPLVPLQKVKVGRQKAMYNDTVVLTCPRDNADGKIKVWWTVRNHRVDSELMPRYKELHNGSLRISGVQYDDALETISCAMQQDDGNSTLIAIARMQLEVNGEYSVYSVIIYFMPTTSLDNNLQQSSLLLFIFLINMSL